MNQEDIGRRVRINEDCRPGGNANGMTGTITRLEDVELMGHLAHAPVITLDDGSGEIKGYECWWEDYTDSVI